jgi:hypothetical protein
VVVEHVADEPAGGNVGAQHPSAPGLWPGQARGRWSPLPSSRDAPCSRALAEVQLRQQSPSHLWAAGPCCG